MECEQITIGSLVRFKNQKWKGKIIGTSRLPEEVQVLFEGEHTAEYISPECLQPFYQGVTA